jgi:DeoR/GlpR family transcriptional regulator of sugar metabolism
VPRATKRVLGQTRQQELLHYLRTFRTGHVAELSELLGHVTVQTLQEFQIDKVFMGAFGIDPDFGFSGANLGETQTDRALFGSSRNLVVLADSSKLAHRGPVRLAPIEAVSTLVTDSGGDSAVLDVIRARSIEVITC